MPSLLVFGFWYFLVNGAGCGFCPSQFYAQQSVICLREAPVSPVQLRGMHFYEVRLDMGQKAQVKSFAAVALAERVVLAQARYRFVVHSIFFSGPWFLSCYLAEGRMCVPLSGLVSST